MTFNNILGLGVTPAGNEWCYNSIGFNQDQKKKKGLINLTTFQAFTVPIQDNEIVPGKKDGTICMWQHYLIQGQQQQVS